MYQDKTIAVVIPAYNEELLIADTINSVPEFVDRVYVVDDCSNDGTAEIIRCFNHDHHRVCCISHSENCGVGAAIVSGYRQALEDSIEVMVVMAGDNQMDPAHLVELITPVVDSAADYSKGDRLSKQVNRDGMSKWRSFGNWQLTFLTRIAAGNRHICDPQNGYTAISRDALEKINIDSVYPGYGYCNDLLVKLCVCRCRIVDIKMPARYGQEKSKIKYRRYIPRVSWLLLKDFLWRIKVKYFKRQDTSGRVDS